MNPFSTELAHHGILGQKWGKHNGPPYPLGSDISTGSRLKKTFVSGSSKTQDPNSEYYKKKLPSGVRRELNSKMKSGNTILVGDAPGIDRQVQDYLKKKGYKNVEVYSPGKQSRYLADKSWENKLIDDPKHEPGSPEWLAKKDKAMAKEADDGIAVILPNGGAKATRNNIARLQSQNKPVSVYELKMNDPNLKKKIAIGAAVAGTALAVAGGVYLYKSGKLNGIIKTGKSIMKDKGAGGIDEDLAKLFTKKVASPHVSSDYKGINPARNALSDVNFILKAKDGKPLQDANCQACTLAYEYKRRTGRDVAAHLIDTRQFTNEYLMEKVYKNPKIIKDQAVSSWSELGSRLSKMGNGARGNLLLNTATGKHSIAFEIVNGKAVFMDTQIEQAFGADSKAFDVVYRASKNGISYLRTDNLQFNDIKIIQSLIHSV